MKITFHGHSFIEVVTDCNILIDPFITDNPLCSSLPDSFYPDYILLTHGHRDHYGDTEGIAQNSKCKIYAMAELSRWIASRGFTAGGFNIGGSFSLGQTRITAVDAIHSNSAPDGSYGGLACGFILQFEGTTIYVAGDTSYFSDMKSLGRKFDISCAFLPIGGTYTMDVIDAVAAAADLSPGICVPVHFNTFDAVKADPEAFCKNLTDRGIDCKVLEPGNSIEF